MKRNAQNSERYHLWNVTKRPKCYPCGTPEVGIKGLYSMSLIQSNCGILVIQDCNQIPVHTDIFQLHHKRWLMLFVKIFTKVLYVHIRRNFYHHYYRYNYHDHFFFVIILMIVMIFPSIAITSHVSEMAERNILHFKCIHQH